LRERTIKFHIGSLYAKLGVTRRTEAIREGFNRGLVRF
jgi:DNA-binding CsgD family transcriptional regulator